MSETLEEWIKQISEIVGQIFAAKGRVAPIFHIIINDAAFLMPVEMSDKEATFAVARAVIQQSGASRYLFISEAWMHTAPSDISKAELRRMQRDGLERHPDRREVVNYQAEDRDGGGASAHQFILRPEVCRPTLSPLHFNEMTPGQSRGRMANMFGEKTRIVDDNGANK